MRAITRLTLRATRPGAAPLATVTSWADLGLTPDALAWHQHAACREVDPAVFFLPVGANAADIRAAKQICAGCPVRATCLAGAIERGEQFGIWGGLTEHERAALPRPRRTRKPARIDASVARLTRAGHSAQQIAQVLHITERTVTRSRARTRLAHTDSRQEAA